MGAMLNKKERKETLESWITNIRLVQHEKKSYFVGNTLDNKLVLLYLDEVFLDHIYYKGVRHTYCGEYDKSPLYAKIDKRSQ